MCKAILWVVLCLGLFTWQAYADCTSVEGRLYQTRYSKKDVQFYFFPGNSKAFAFVVPDVGNGEAVSSLGQWNSTSKNSYTVSVVFNTFCSSNKAISCKTGAKVVFDIAFSQDDDCSSFRLKNIKDQCPSRQRILERFGEFTEVYQQESSKCNLRSTIWSNSITLPDLTPTNLYVFFSNMDTVFTLIDDNPSVTSTYDNTLIQSGYSLSDSSSFTLSTLCSNELEGACLNTDKGTYTYKLDNVCDNLQVSVVADTCISRQDIFAGMDVFRYILSPQVDYQYANSISRGASTVVTSFPEETISRGISPGDLLTYSVQQTYSLGITASQLPDIPQIKLPSIYFDNTKDRTSEIYTYSGGKVTSFFSPNALSPVVIFTKSNANSLYAISWVYAVLVAIAFALF